MFVNKYKQLNVVKNCKIFLNKMEKLKLYIIEFDKNGIMKPKIYLSDCIVENNNK